TLAELVAAVDAGEIPARGEVVVVVGWLADPGSRPGAALTATASATTEAGARGEVEALVAGGMGRSAAARRVAAATGIPRRRLYGSPTSR
ncbi:MAG TPA: hypothetical protein VLS28_12945, partial [Candidatus Sulfomarinibacteraceae bacterium]|nr:hypothetical protein [Candidatus Sulfomarinibacteraceae bacterium]